jgi:GNAT superfamily N-acetyltransferase
MSGIRLSSEPTANPADVATLQDHVNEYNMLVTGVRDYQPVRIFLRDEANAVRGGILADIWGGWMHIGYLWVDEALRKQGLATKLLAAAEAECRTYGCRNMTVETFSFQARPLYEKQQFRVIASLENYPPGHTFYILQKSLADE